MNYRSEICIKDRHRRDRRIWRKALALSVITHLIGLLLLSVVPIPSLLDMSSGSKQAREILTSSSLRTVNIGGFPNLPNTPSAPTPVHIQEVDLDHTIAGDTALLLNEMFGNKKLMGLSGEAMMSGNTNSVKGSLSRISATPRNIIIPSNKNDLRGKEIQVWVFVDEDGDVIADSTYLDPAGGDPDFNQHLILEAAEWLFRPATWAGEPIASWFTYRISMH